MRNTAKIRDITGQKFNCLTVIRIAQRNPLRWECVCDCGNTHIVGSSNLISGKVKSCGCLQKKGNPKHNHCYERIYRIYAKIKRRCFVKDDPAYHNYGGRGITMCDEWKNSFQAFYEWAYSNGYKEGLTIDRIDNDGDYSPDNCRWADLYQQANNKRNNLVFTLNGKTQTLPNWCRETNMPYSAVWYRITNGWGFEKAITCPVNRKGKKNERTEQDQKEFAQQTDGFRG